MKKLNPLIKFKNFWDRLSFAEQSKLWYFLTASREPDNENCELKHKTTAIIRSYLLNIGNCCPATVNKVGKFKGEGNTHFMIHAKEAMRVIKDSKLKRIVK